MTDIRREMKERSRLARGLVNALGCDMDYICSDIDSNDLICMDESIAETKRTIQNLIDNITELEYLVYLLKGGDSRKKQTPL